MKHLPKSLSLFRGAPLHEEVRKNLTRLTGDGRTRIVYSLHDTGQPMPHCAVALRGRDIVGWVLRAGRHNDSVDSAGETVSEMMEMFLPAPDQDDLRRNFMEGSELALLNQTVGTLRERESFRGQVESFTEERTTWHNHTCSILVSYLGMIEVVPQDLLNKKALARPGEFQVQALVPCEKGWAWEAVPLSTARARAEWELRSPPFWNLPKRSTTLLHEGIPFDATSFSDAFPQLNGKLSESFIEALVEVKSEHVHPTKGNVELRAWRHNSDRYWSIDLSVDGMKQHRTYPIISGRLALELAELAAMQAGLPPVTAAVEDVKISADAFQGVIDRVHERGRELRFVCDALNITRAPPAASEATL